MAMALSRIPVILFARDSDKWDGNEFDDYLNQGVKTYDDVTFSSCRAVHKSSDGSTGISATIAGYDNYDYVFKDGILVSKYYAGGP